MRFVRYVTSGAPQWGVEHGSQIHPLSSLPTGEPSVEDLANPSYRKRIRRALNQGALASMPAADVRRLAPVPRPGQIICVALV